MAFDTTVMAPLQQINLENLNLPAEILIGIRTLSYDRVTKVVIKFKKLWWFKNPDNGIIRGGVSTSDPPIPPLRHPPPVHLRQPGHQPRPAGGWRVLDDAQRVDPEQFLDIRTHSW
ncbi:hypothetical protein B0H67DRAFT_676488 [Lasiosphaeris hirsuta]|uniref:Uncharacterized protein n=1 Tax=Lasiosphaeris hirsuta TaxID=260670 RepID=A0AA40DG73_9PEZI|nr:hypothetical protein B0H67DRAFT_676488 [Lasiosphaeris hirsuta]